MKSLLWIICIPGLVCSENITKREGETVVLHVNEPQKLIDYLWTYGSHAPTRALAVVTNGHVKVSSETRFTSRHRLDISSGTMTISNLTIGDSGTFLMQTLTGIERHFKLTVTGNSIFISAAEGSNVTLTSELEQLDPKHHHLFWTESDFSGKRIVTWENNVVTYDPELRDHLLLNPQTGSLTLISITKNLSEFYCIRMMYETDPHILIKYLVHVYSEVSVPHLSYEEQSLSPAPWSCRVNCSVLDSDDVVLTWYRGDTVLNQSSDADVSSHLILTLDVPLNSKEDTFTCEAANPISKRTVVFNTTYGCPLHEEKIQWTRYGIIVVTLCPIIIVAIVIVRCIICKKCKSQPSCQGLDCYTMDNMNQTAQDSEQENLAISTDN